MENLKDELKCLPVEIKNIIGIYSHTSYIFDLIDTQDSLKLKDKYRNAIITLLDYYDIVYVDYENDIFNHNDTYYIYLSSENFHRVSNMIIMEEFKKVCFYGPIKHIGDEWLNRHNNITDLSFIGLHKLEKMGNWCLLNCKNLTTISFEGLTRLKSIGNWCMTGSDSLLDINFKGLESLKYVGYRWMSDCKNIKTISFESLNKLKKAEGFWMIGCDNLSDIKFNRMVELKI